MVKICDYQLERYKHKQKIRLVEPFSIGSLQANTQVKPFKSPYNDDRPKIEPTLFGKYFIRGDIPIRRAYGKKTPTSKTSTSLNWQISLTELDYSHYLPIFFDGLRATKSPFHLFARHGINEMLKAGGSKVLPIIPQLIPSIRQALKSRNKEVIIVTLKAIQQLLMTDRNAGPILVGYGRQLLPPLNYFYHVNVNIGDAIDSAPEGQIGDVIETTLQMLECCGGPDAYINIKYMIPTYESSVFNK